LTVLRRFFVGFPGQGQKIKADDEEADDDTIVQFGKMIEKGKRDLYAVCTYPEGSGPPACN